jgi:hypothetical protein
MGITSNGEYMRHGPAVDQLSAAGPPVFRAKRFEHRGNERGLVRICLRSLIVPCSVAARRRKFELLAASCLAPLSLGLSEPALAQCDGTPDNVICTTSGNDYSSPVAGNPYQTAPGISVGTNKTPINVTLDQGVVVNIPAAGNNVAHAVALDNTGGSAGTGVPATLIANNAAITINTTSINPPDTSALFVHAAGNATIGTATNPVSGIINVTGTTSTNALWATVFTTANVPKAVASVTYAGPATGPGITATGGPNSTLIQACANDDCGFGNVVNGDAFIDAAGNLKGVGGSAPSTNGMNGLFAAAGGNGDATVNYHRGTIDITQSDTGTAAGIFAASGDVGSAAIKTDLGTTVMVRGQGSAVFGIDAFASGGNATADVASTILITDLLISDGVSGVV